jgi:uncharacterized protein
MTLPGIIAGFTLGILSSWHCAGMCGPLALALPVHHLSAAKKSVALLTYQCGRIITYSILGLIFGLAGSRFYIAGMQQWFSLSIGVAILVFAVLYYNGKRTIRFTILNHFHFFIQKTISRLLRSAKSPSGYLLLGMANGLLPCGLVYLAIAGALTFSNAFRSMAFMASFGAGTVPVMMIAAYAGHLMSYPVRQVMKKAVPVFITAMAIILILRGLNLGIPFISPELPEEVAKTVSCHN